MAYYRINRYVGLEGIILADSNAPVSDTDIISTLAKAFRLNLKEIFVPILQAKSFLASRPNVIPQIESSLCKFDLGSGPGVVDGLKIIGGLVAAAEGLSIFANAAQVGTAVVVIAGVSVSAAMATLIGLGLAVLGAWLLYKGVQAMWPYLRQRLMDNIGDELKLLGG